MIAEGSVACAGGDEVENETGEWLGEHHGRSTEAQAYVIGAGVDVSEGEAADGGGGLRVEQHEQAGNAVFGADGLVAQ